MPIVIGRAAPCLAISGGMVSKGEEQPAQEHPTGRRGHTIEGKGHNYHNLMIKYYSKQIKNSFL
jgi:hypothetical protein